MAALIGSFDWSSTALGAIDQWPQSLQTIIGFLVRSDAPDRIAAEPGGAMIHNDGYSAFAGARHPTCPAGTSVTVGPRSEVVPSFWTVWRLG
jgi:hypothetical protein